MGGVTRPLIRYEYKSIGHSTYIDSYFSLILEFASGLCIFSVLYVDTVISELIYFFLMHRILLHINLFLGAKILRRDPYDAMVGTFESTRPRWLLSRTVDYCC